MTIELIVQSLEFPSFGEGYELSESCMQSSDSPFLSFHNLGDRGQWLANVFAVTCTAFPEGKCLTIDIREHLDREEIRSMGISPTARLKLVPEALYQRYGSGMSLLLAIKQKSKVIGGDNIQFDDDIPLDFGGHDNHAPDEMGDFLLQESVSATDSQSKTPESLACLAVGMFYQTHSEADFAEAVASEIPDETAKLLWHSLSRYKEVEQIYIDDLLASINEKKIQG